jgi:ribosomal protein L22
MTPEEKPTDEQAPKEEAKAKPAAAKKPAAKSSAEAKSAAAKKPAAKKPAASDTDEDAATEKKPARARKAPAKKDEPVAIKEAAAEKPAAKKPAASKTTAKKDPVAEKASGAKAEKPAPAKTEEPKSTARRDAQAASPARRKVVRAQARYVRTSARKARMVCGHLRGKSVPEARAILAFTPREVARDWSKLLESAVANAENNHELVEDDLFVREAYADEGPTIKRFRPRAQGRATPIRKRTSHLTITLTPKP